LAKAIIFQSPLGVILPALSRLKDVIAQAMNEGFFYFSDASWGIYGVELIGRKSFQYGMMEFALYWEQ
jgi:hypothetical protein